MDYHDIYAIIFAVVIIAVGIAALGYSFIRRHILGTFKFDNSGETYRCLLEFEDLDGIEKHKFAIVRIQEARLNPAGVNRTIGNPSNGRQ